MLVDQDYAAPRRPQRRQRHPLEGLEVHAVATHPRRPRQLRVGQRVPRPVEGLDRETHPAAPFPELLHREGRHSRGAFLDQRGQAAEGRGLARTRASFYEQARRAQ
jgi:hypothetical protein